MPDQQHHWLLFVFVVNGAAKPQGGIRTPGMHHRVKHLVCPMFLPVNAIIHQTNVFRVFARDVGRAKNNIPKNSMLPKLPV